MGIDCSGHKETFFSYGSIQKRGCSDRQTTNNIYKNIKLYALNELIVI